MGVKSVVLKMAHLALTGLFVPSFFQDHNLALTGFCVPSSLDSCLGVLQALQRVLLLSFHDRPLLPGAV